MAFLQKSHDVVKDRITGYAEGYYGRLLGWSERRQILDTLQQQGLTTYYYAPKEDVCHRLYWRTPYSALWRQHFRDFCEQAAQRGIQVVAGVAPGLDFDFSHLPDGADFRTLLLKCRLLLADGAQAISLLMDDIDADFDARCGQFDEEGEAHAALANALASALSAENTSQEPSHGFALWVTPRIYADELIPSAPDYLPSFLATLHTDALVLYCGSDVVAHTIDNRSLDALDSATSDGLKHQVIIWDNLYANDYCPRRLFVGAWERRHGLHHVLLNPTGMVHTDCLLLALMGEGLRSRANAKTDALSEQELWRRVLLAHDVPEAFMTLAPYFHHPVFNGCGADAPSVDSDLATAAIEHCLWRWKSPLSREWYPAIFGLKHDLLTLAGEHPSLRIRKTQNAPLATLLLAAAKCPDSRD